MAHTQTIIPTYVAEYTRDSMLFTIAEVMTVEFDTIPSFFLSDAQLDMSLWAETLFYDYKVWCSPLDRG